MADRDVTLDIVATDKTGPGTRSAARNLKTVEKSWKDVDGQGKRTLAAAQHIAGQWGRGLSKIGGHTKRWADSGDTAGKRFVKGIGAGIGKLADLGGSIGGGLSKAISAAGPYVQVALAAVLVAGAVAAAPLIGSVIAGAMVGGAGALGIAGGVALAMKDARVAGAVNGLKAYISDGLTDAAQAFVPATLKAVNSARTAFQRLMPDLRRLFNATAPFLDPLVKSIGRATKSMLNGITNAVEKAGPIFKSIGTGVELIGKTVGEAFDSLKDNGAGMAAGLTIVFQMIAANIKIAGMALNFLVESFEFFVKKIPGGKKWLDSFKSSSDGAKGSADGLAGGFRLLGGDANTAASGIANLKAKSDEFVDGNISLGRAQIAAREATKTATAAIIDNSKAKITNKERADRNMTALYDLADAFNTETTAGDKSGVSAGKAAAAYSTNRAKLIAMAEKAGYSKTKAEELASTLLKQPKNVNTDVNVNTATAKSNVEIIKKAIKTIKGKTVYITVKARTNPDGSIHVSGPGGSGTLTFAGYQSWQGAADNNTGSTSRTGGPTKVESTVNQTLNVSLDGTPFYAYTARAIKESERRQDWRQKVGRR